MATDLHSPLPKSATDLFGDPIEDSHPLWLNPSKFSDSEFDPESYISDLRTFVPFDTLRSELRSHLGALKHELVELINRDYADFVSLSTKLVDVDAAVVRMRAPLLEIKEKILSFRGSVDGSLAALQIRLKHRSQANEARELLELLLDTFHVVSKNVVLAKSHKSGTQTSRRLLFAVDHPLSYPTWKANGAEVCLESWKEGARLIADVRNVAIKDVLPTKYIPAYYSLFSACWCWWPVPCHELKLGAVGVEKLIKELPTVPADWPNGTVNSTEKDQLSNGISFQHAENGTNLRETQSMLLERIASEMNRLKFYIAHAQPLCGGITFRLQNMPFIENMVKRIQNASLLLDTSLGHCFVDGLEHRDENAIYNCLRAYAAIDNTSSAEEIFRSTVVAPFIQKIIPHGSSRAVENSGYCPSRSAVAKLREETVYIEFMKQWNTGVYFSLRFQEIAGALDSALMTATLVPTQNSNQEYSQSLVLKQSLSLMDCLRSCWRDDVLLLSCSDKFLRLFLQLLSRYSNWLSAGLNARKAGNASANSGSEWAISAASDDFLYIIHDLNCLVEEVCGDYLGHVLGLLKSCSPEVLDLVKQSILQGGNSLKVLQPLVINSIVETLVEKSVEDLRQLKGITATFRMTNKPLPVRHSLYVSGVLRPLKSFLEGKRAATYLTSELRKELLQGAAFEITRRYYELASDLVSVARKTESSLQKIRLGAQRRAGASSDVSDHNVSDTDKICMQLFLDIQEYGRNLASLGVDAANIPEYRSLWQCVAPSDKQSTIKF
ncbi:hypothetical protein DH2020_042546 [Rehmannia glutinosa]|uniref:Conserved oligomeric Golgi complex subunit 2 n=1 Tax=Rehmannia glutinosa TaxID=99300 RepID=A0ABR0UML6_REHGL